MNKKTNIYLLISLVTSLVINGFFLGFCLSKSIRDHRMPPPTPSQHLYEATRHLSPETRKNVMVILDKRTPELDAQMHEGFDSFQKIRDVMTTQDVNTAKIDQTFNRLNKHHEETGILLGTMLKEIYMAIPTPKERSAFFKKALPPKPDFHAPPPPPIK